jgi:putative ATPase
MTQDLFSKIPTEKVAPLAERMRPHTLDQFEGQPDVVGAGSMLRQAIESEQIPSMILWGPPGTGKTTLAHIISQETKTHFVSFSAVLSGVKEIRTIIAEAQNRLTRDTRPTLLFVDEIHRFNKSQQDSFLPHVENGVIVLIGATTENPSFEVNAALLSRCRVVTLKALDEHALKSILDRAMEDSERGLGGQSIEIDQRAQQHLIDACHGDARVLLNALEIAANGLKKIKGAGRIDLEQAEKAIQSKALLYDKAGEEHYNVISAFIKSIRGSDPDGAVYWLARMLEAGEDPLFIARRLVILASEDVANADPRALDLAVSTMQAVHMIGLPEAQLNLAHCTCYLACAPKSNRTMVALSEAKRDVRSFGPLPVPDHLRNAPTKLMKDLGYGHGYQYDHNAPGAHSGQQHLPDRLKKRTYYRPSDQGIEARIKERLEWLRGKKPSS